MICRRVGRDLSRKRFLGFGDGDPSAAADVAVQALFRFSWRGQFFVDCQRET
jgi:hypothetical protein